MSLNRLFLNVRNVIGHGVLRIFDRLLGRGINAPYYKTKICTSFPQPNSIESHVLYITKVGNIPKWASFQCPGRCGKIVRLRLARHESPRWTVRNDWMGRTSFYPSIRQQTNCKCHFWVKRGRIIWSTTNRQQSPDSVNRIIPTLSR